MMQGETIKHEPKARAARCWATALLMMATLLAQAAGDSDRTVVIACDWDFAPYEFINSDTHKDGFCVEVLHTLMNEMGVKHQFVMKARRLGVENFQAGKADLLLDYRDRFSNDDRYRRSLSVLGYYTVAAACGSDRPPLRKLSEMRDRNVMMTSNGDTLLEQIARERFNAPDLEFTTPREALSGIASGDTAYYVFGKEVLEWKIKEYNLHDIVVTPLDIPSYEIHVVGRDQQLIDAIDNQFARWQQSGKIDQIRNKWFHPERMPQESSPAVIYIILAVALLSVFVFAIYRLTRARVRVALRHNEDMEAMMRKALNMGKYSVIMNDLRQNRLTNHHGSTLPEEGMTREQMLERVHPDDLKAMMNRSKTMQGMPGKPYQLNMRWNVGTKENPQWVHTTGYSYAEYNSHGRPTNVIIITRDITEEVKKAQEERDLTSRYIKMFDSTLVAMSFYDKEGNLINLNENMKKLCGLTEERLDFFRKVTLYDIEMMKGDFEQSTVIDTHFCQHMYYPEIDIDKYIELRIYPTFDEKGELLYYVITARDVTEERKLYMEMHNQGKAISDATKTGSMYERELKTLLENCDMYVWHADPKDGRISFSRSLHAEGFGQTMDEYFSELYDEHREQAKDNIRKILTEKKPFNVLHHFHRTPVNAEPSWCAVSGMPLLDDNGNVKQLFGLVRDITSLLEAQERLREETQRAENSAMLKSTFLANMTHEIRTPLNAIVGFSDLLQSIDDAAERKQIIGIIRNNCDMLMRLVNDILEASTMDVKPLTIEPRDIDFAAEFLIVCQSLEQRVQEPGVEYIVDAPYKHFHTSLDMGRMQQVITNFVINAIKYTHKGHIKVGYRRTTPTDTTATTLLHGISNLPKRHGLFIYCEDTGKGIPKEKQAMVFERFVKLDDFVQGTGLGLAISKSIADRCGGEIGLKSEGEGCGSTFWMWIPCEETTKPHS